MSAHSTGPSAHNSGGQARPYLIAFIATIIYAALLIACYGFISLLLNRDIIAEPGVGVLIGPAMALGACAIVFIGVSRGPARRQHPVRLPVGRSVTTALAVYLLGPVIGGILYAMGRTEPFAAITFFFRYLGSPFVICSAVVAIAVVLAAPFFNPPTVH